MRRELFVSLFVRTSDGSQNFRSWKRRYIPIQLPWKLALAALMSQWRPSNPFLDHNNLPIGDVAPDQGRLQR